MSFFLFASSFLLLLQFSYTNPTDGYREAWGSQRGSEATHQVKKCPLVTKIISDVIYEEVNEEVCEVQKKKICSKKPTEICESVDDEVCEMTSIKKCTANKIEKCHNYTKRVNESFSEEVCVDKYFKECEDVWKIDKYGKGSWIEDSLSCHQLKRTKCQPVSTTKPTSVLQEKCEIQELPSCNFLPIEECKPIKKEKCMTFEIDSCKVLPRTVCQNVKKQMPRQIKKEIRLRSCSKNKNDVTSYQ
ncbi:unnamed protein product [Lepeophtheirus salmonis]|uniref:(salmon louse) hypothetical protein n=1 Tax=Lepeophtheirus salmonis TaxID=72036 RepID=A0A7R8CWA8_LEPSM|nr:unnamed protein product [Lepeophtheirus salmonis]CAF2901686.1 unnamed protein product [Lepeophtheirus salmonis]